MKLVPDRVNLPRDNSNHCFYRGPYSARPAGSLSQHLPYLLALLVAITPGCSMFGGGDSWYSGPDEKRVTGIMRDHAMPIVEEREGKAVWPPRCIVEVVPGSVANPPPGTPVIQATNRSYFQPPDKMVFAETYFGRFEFVREECVHMVRYVTFGVLDHDVRYKDVWVAH